MTEKIRKLAVNALGEAHKRFHGDVPLSDKRGEKGYVIDLRNNLLPCISLDDFKADFRKGKGDELKKKFRAPHSSAALAVNGFARFRDQSRIASLIVPKNIGGGFSDLKFEQKCPIDGVRGTPPHLDVVLLRSESVVGIESKLTEPIPGGKAADFKEVYDTIPNKRRNQGYYDEMQRLRSAPKDYQYLDAAQLIKHAFGLTDTYKDCSVTLFYLYWEPENKNDDELCQLFETHRNEIKKFSQQVSGSHVKFEAMSYPELWNEWRKSTSNWMPKYIYNLKKRYRVDI